MMPNVKRTKIKVTPVTNQDELYEFLKRHNVYSRGDGVKLTPTDTKCLSTYLTCFSPDFCNKFLSCSTDPQVTCYVALAGGNDGNRPIFVWSRRDNLSIDIDLAVVGDNNMVSSIYHSSFAGRTSLSADTINQFKNCKTNFKIDELSVDAPILYNAFQYGDY